MAQMCQCINTIANSATPAGVVSGSPSTAPSGCSPSGGDLSGLNITIPVTNATTGMVALPTNNAIVSNVQNCAGVSTTNTGSPASVWSNINPSQVINSDIPCFDRRAGVSESCLKEALTCEISPLGFHLPPSIKEKIWHLEYIDILSLLPSSKEFSKPDKKSDEKEDERKRSAPKTFYNWVQAFCIFASVLGEKSPQYCSGLFRHLESILEAHKNFGGNAWYQYDESFRQKLALYPGVKWGTKDVGLWLNLMLPQRSSMTRSPTNQNTPKKGLCFAFNSEGVCKFDKNCRYKHECSHCGGAHSAAKCYKKAQVNNKEPFQKGSESSDTSKTGAVARSLSRQTEG